MEDYSALQDQQDQIDQQVKLAQMLRLKQPIPGAASNSPEGQMISGRFVAPHWTQQMAAVMNPLIQQSQANQADRNVLAQKSVLRQALAQAQQKWQAQAPQGIPGTPGVVGHPELPGPVNPEGGSPELGAVASTAPTAPQLPTTDQILRHTLAGMQIPGNEGAAGVYNKGALADQAREDTQAERRSTLTMALEAARQNKLDALQQRRDQIDSQMQDRQLSREQAATLAHESNATRLQIAELSKGMASGMQNARLEDMKNREADRMQQAFVNNPIVKESSTGADHAQRAIAMLDGRDLIKKPLTATEQNDLMDMYQRSINPGASVRIGTLKMMQGSLPLAQQAEVLKNMLIGQGGKLSTQQSTDILNQLRKINDYHSNTIKTAASGVTEKASRRGINAADVVPSQYSHLIEGTADGLPAGWK